MRRIVAALALLLMASAVPCFGQATVMPVPIPTFTNASGLACNACTLETYAAGTSTPLATYQDANATVPHANPVVLNSVGRPNTGTPIYLLPTTYKFILKSSGGTTIYTADNVSAIPRQITGVSNATDVVFQVDTDNDGSNVFSFLSGTSIQKAVIDEDGDLQIDGSLTVGDATEADKQVTFDGNAQDYHLGLDDSADALVLGRGTALGTTTSLSVNTSGQITLNTDLLFTDATYDIGKTGATRPRDFFLSRNATIGGTLGVTGASTLAAVSATTVVPTSAAPASPVARTLYQDSLVVAWGRIANNGTASITDDVNISAVNRTSAGVVDVTFATAIAGTPACIVAGVNGSTPSGAWIDTVSTTGLTVRTYATNFGTLADFPFTVVCVGE